MNNESKPSLKEPVATLRRLWNTGYSAPATVGDALAIIDELTEENERLRSLYDELLLEVVNKVPGETRHETARRIIRQHENQESLATKVSDDPTKVSDDP